VCLKLGHFSQNCDFGWEIDGGDDDDDDSPPDIGVPYLQSNPDMMWTTKLRTPRNIRRVEALVSPTCWKHVLITHEQ
jgi:hypothetical protein